MYNAQNYIKQGIQSILDQDLQPDIEILIINDGSSDDSYDIVNNISCANLRILNQKNQGVSRTRNRGILEAKGRYIWFMDSDDYLMPGVIIPLLKTALLNDLDVLRFDLRRTNRSYQSNLEHQTKYSIKELTFEKGTDHIARYNYHEGPVSYMVKKKHLIENRIFFEEDRIMEDMLFTMQVLTKASKVAYIPIDAYRYLFNPKSLWNNLDRKHNSKVTVDFSFMSLKIHDLIQELIPNSNQMAIINLKKKLNSTVANVFLRSIISDLDENQMNILLKSLAEKKIYPFECSWHLNQKNILIKLLSYPKLFRIIFKMTRYDMAQSVIQRIFAKKQEKLSRSF